MFAPAPFSLALSYNRPETCQNWSKSFWRHSPVLVLDAFRKRVKVGCLDDFEFVASFLCVTGAALSIVLVEFCGRRGTLELSCKFRGRRSTLAPGCRFRGRHVTLTQRDRSRCGAVRILRTRSEPSAHVGWHILRTRSEPSAHFGWVKSLSLWRDAHFEHAKRTLCALWVGQIALAVARCAF